MTSNEQFEGKRTELLGDRDALIATAKEYLKKNYFKDTAKHSAESLVKTHERSQGMLSWEQWNKLAGMVAYIQIKDEEQEDEHEVRANARRSGW